MPGHLHAYMDKCIITIGCILCAYICTYTGAYKIYEYPVAHRKRQQQSEDEIKKGTHGYMNVHILYCHICNAYVISVHGY